MAEANENEWVDGKFVLPLDESIPDPEVEGGRLKSITLRKPTGGDMIEAGNPVTFNPMDESNPYRIDEKKMGAMISRLAALPPSIIRQMAPKDMLRASHVISPFFLPF